MKQGSQIARLLLSEQLKQLCKCGHPRAKHAHAAAFCQGVDHGYVMCLCDKFQLPEEESPAESK